MSAARSTPATRALAAGAMVAGFVPDAAPPVARPASRESALPNGAQLATWKQREIESLQAQHEVRRDNLSRRYATWYRWAIGWQRAGVKRTKARLPRADRALLCAVHGVQNTGRQWRRLRKMLRRQERAA